METTTTSSSPSPPRTSSDSTPSPEFQFHPSLSSPSSLLSADQLFSGGLILPLHLLNTPLPPPPPTNSKHWTHIFKKNPPSQHNKHKNNNNKADGNPSDQLININLWPFARSRSAGTSAAARQKWAVPARKATSAPCSRSNSAGESKSHRWPPSPAAGVHVGRASPVWQLPRTASRSRKETGNRRRKGGAARSETSGRAKVGVLSLKVPVCYRSNLSCQSDGSSVAGVAAGGGLFGLRGLFSSKKAVY